jgi:hypothetical protein
MNKPKLDMVEIISPASNIISISENHFINQQLIDEATGDIISDCSYLNLKNFMYGNKPLGIKSIKIDRIRDVVTFIITAKILLQYYSKLITWETIKLALNNLIELGFINFDPDLVINLSMVSSFDLTKDIPISMPAENYLRDLNILGTKHNYRIKSYKSGVEVYSGAKSNEHRMIIYQKYEELCSNNEINRRLLKFIDKEHFKNTLRIEANFKTPAMIRKYFKIKKEEDIMLKDILNYEENVLANYFNQMWSELTIKETVKDIWDADLAPTELAKKIGMREIIRVCGYNRVTINSFLKTKLKGKKKTSFYMPSFDNELEEMKTECFGKKGSAKAIEELRKKLEEV